MSSFLEKNQKNNVIDDIDPVIINVRYVLGNDKYIPFIFKPIISTTDSIIKIKTFNIYANTTVDCEMVFNYKHLNNVLIINKWSINKANSNIRNLADIHIDNDDNLIIVWILNNNYYELENISNANICRPNVSKIVNGVSNFEFNINNIIYNINVLSEIANTNFKLLNYEYIPNKTDYERWQIQQSEVKESIPNPVNSLTLGGYNTDTKVADVDIDSDKNVSLQKSSNPVLNNPTQNALNSGLDYKSINEEINTIKESLDDIKTSIGRNEIFTTDTCEKDSKYVVDGTILESYIPIMFRLPETNSKFTINITGLKDVIDNPINYFSNIEFFKCSDAVFIDFSYRQEKRYIAWMCINKEKTHLIIWFRRFIVYNILLNGIDFDIETTQKNMLKVNPELKPDVLKNSVYIDSSYDIYSNLNIDKDTKITIKMSDFPQIIANK